MRLLCLIAFVSIFSNHIIGKCFIFSNMAVSFLMREEPKTKKSQKKNKLNFFSKIQNFERWLPFFPFWFSLLLIYVPKKPLCHAVVEIYDANQIWPHLETTRQMWRWAHETTVTIPVPMSEGRGRCCERSVLTIIYHHQQIVTTHCANWININTWYFRCQLSIAPGPGHVSGQH